MCNRIKIGYVKMKSIHKQCGTKPIRKKPGPKVITPSNKDRHNVELAVSIGMSLEAIADALDISRRTLSRTFVRELAVGRSKQMLASIVRLDDLAAAGNVAACKFLHSLMMNNQDNKPEAAIEDDKWSALADKIQDDLDREANLPKNSEFWKN